MTCSECQRPPERLRRGMCSACYQQHWKAGDLTRFPGSTRRIADTVEDYEFLAHNGYTRAG